MSILYIYIYVFCTKNCLAKLSDAPKRMKSFISIINLVAKVIYAVHLLEATYYCAYGLKT